MNDNVISGQDALGSASLAQEDLLLIDDGPGTVKKVTFSNFEDSIFANVSGDAAIAAGGALTIAAGAVATERVVYSDITTVTAPTGDVDMEVTVPANGLITDMGFIITAAIPATPSNTLTIRFGTSVGGGEFVAAVQVNATSAGLALGTSASVLARNKAVGSGTVFAGFVDGVKLYDTTEEVVHMQLVIGGANLANAAGRIRQFVKYIVIS